MKATLFQLMNCDPNAFECIGNLCRGGVRMVLKVAIYLYSAQHQQIGFRREIETSANKVFQSPLFKALAVFLPKHIHALRNGIYHLVTQHWHQALFVILDPKLLASPGQQAGHAYWRDAWKLRHGSLHFNLSVFRQLPFQRYAQFVAKRINHEVRHLVAVLLQLGRNNAVKNISIR
ncbi:hypothetical protein D3C71_1384840 [compost metagenome]